MTSQITIFNFDDVYLRQDFYKEEMYDWLDCTDLKGVNSYCDEEALKELRKRIKERPWTPIHFMDSGNYHYVTYLLLEHIKEPFTLVLFDHHTDMQPPLMEGMLSCGSWVCSVLEENVYLQEILLIGAKEESIRQIECPYKERIRTISEEELIQNTWEEILTHYIHYPVYISIDKDVIDDQEAYTNWDQGMLSLQMLQTMYAWMRRNHKVIGIDVCGEYKAYEPMLREAQTYNALNNEGNRQILQWIKEG